MYQLFCDNPFYVSDYYFEGRNFFDVVSELDAWKYFWADGITKGICSFYYYVYSEIGTAPGVNAPLTECYVLNHNSKYGIPEDPHFFDMKSSFIDLLLSFHLEGLANLVRKNDFEICLALRDEEANEFVIERNLNYFVGASMMIGNQARGYKKLDTFYFLCPVDLFVEIYTKFFDIMGRGRMGFIIQKGSFEHLESLHSESNRDLQWVIKVLDNVIMHFEQLWDDIAFRIVSREVNLKRFIEDASLKEINTRLAAINCDDIRDEEGPNITRVAPVPYPSE